MLVEKSAGVVIFRKEKGIVKYLLLYYEGRHWDFPKGKIERGEKLKATAKRETKEETGIDDIEFIPGFKETSQYFYKRKKQNIFKTVVFYLAKTKINKVKISLEHKAYKWLSYNEALKQLTFKNAKNILKKANDFVSKKSF